MLELFRHNRNAIKRKLDSRLQNQKPPPENSFPLLSKKHPCIDSLYMDIATFVLEIILYSKKLTPR